MRCDAKGRFRLRVGQCLCDESRRRNRRSLCPEIEPFVIPATREDAQRKGRNYILFREKAEPFYRSSWQLRMYETHPRQISSANVILRTPFQYHRNGLAGESFRYWEFLLSFCNSGISRRSGWCSFGVSYKIVDKGIHAWLILRFFPTWNWGIATRILHYSEVILFKSLGDYYCFTDNDANVME